jgi:hypothetical protein
MSLSIQFSRSYALVTKPAVQWHHGPLLSESPSQALRPRRRSSQREGLAGCLELPDADETSFCAGMSSSRGIVGLVCVASDPAICHRVIPTFVDVMKSKALGASIDTGFAREKFGWLGSKRREWRDLVFEND